MSLALDILVTASAPASPFSTLDSRTSALGRSGSSTTYTIAPANVARVIPRNPFSMPFFT